MLGNVIVGEGGKEIEHNGGGEYFLIIERVRSPIETVSACKILALPQYSRGSANEYTYAH